ncbi:MAG: alpha-glucosidase [Turicibacter sp.]|nr:alpha-glucosidase [Turicibacter sp.]
MRKWWKEAVGYQIYPKSFYDANGDGVGDIRGIIEKLDYLQDLGVNLLWLCPVYKSPMDDNGYDVSDYYGIAPEFGTMDDFRELLQEAKERNIKIIMDLVLNHTSDEHPWFQAACQESSPYRDFYIWHPGKPGGKEPNNWGSFFTPSCWEWHEPSQKFYMHIFSKKMPDLNWRHRPMREKLYEMARWWLDLGVDGFRVDAVAHLERQWDLADSSKSGHGPYREDWGKFSNLPKVHEYLREMHEEVFSKYDIVTVGEVGGDAGIDAALNYAGPGSNQLDMVFTFDHCWMNRGWNSYESGWHNRTDLYWLKQTFKKWQTGLYGKAWNPLYWLNHDHPRVMSQYGDPENFPKESGKMLATALMFMWGTPFIYNGEEIGMTNPNYEELSDYKDQSTMEKAQRLLDAGHDPKLVKRYIQTTSRDNSRTPMQWDDGAGGGFGSQTPWIKMNPNYKQVNAKQQILDKDSLYHYYKKLIALRRASHYKDVMVYGDFALFDEFHPNIFAFTRHYQGMTLLVACNFFAETAYLGLGPLALKEEVASNYPDANVYEGTLCLRPYEAVVYELKN